MSDSIDPDETPEPEDIKLEDVKVSQAGDRDAVLAAVLREQSGKADVAALAREVRIRRQGFGFRHVTLGFALVTALWVWIFPPSVFWITAPGPPPVEVEQATLRMVMYFQAQKIEQYLLDTGRVPLELNDAGPSFRGMEYIRLTNRDYRILGRGPPRRDGRVTLSYSSVEALDFLVEADASVLDLMAFD
jgi:hypothetical protein